VLVAAPPAHDEARSTGRIPIAGAVAMVRIEDSVSGSVAARIAGIGPLATLTPFRAVRAVEDDVRARRRSA
jgi:hypothetical protein